MIRTLGQLKLSRIPAFLGLCPTDPRLIQWCNECQDELLSHGRFWGTYVAGEFCTQGGLVAWPRNVAAVEQITICGHTIIGHNQWYKFMSPVSQPEPCGTCGCRGTERGCGECGALVWTDEGVQPVYRQLTVPRFIKLYPRSATDVGKRVLIQGDDVNHEWVRKFYGGVPVDGEYVTLANPFSISTVQYSAITGIQKDATDLNVLAYSYDPVTGHELAIADWGPDEVTPSYRMSAIPCLRNQHHHHCGPSSVNAMVKLEHIPVSVDTDWLLIQNEIAIKAGMHARQLYERNQDTLADKEMLRAINSLNHELRTHTGDRSEMFVDLGAESFRNDLNGFR